MNVGMREQRNGKGKRERERELRLACSFNAYLSGRSRDEGEQSKEKDCLRIPD